jgi:carboxypeptidase D
MKVFKFVNRYEVIGGMQDYNYARSNAFDITFELSCCKYPPGSMLPDQWLLNKESLIKYLEQAHLGIKGNVYICIVAFVLN